MLMTDLALAGFMRYEDLEVRWRPGLTLLVGPNGTGKSTLYEAIVWALYGQTVRDNPPQGAKICVAKVTARAAGATWEVARTRGPKGSAELALCRDGKNEGGQTPTETQAKVDALFGDYRRFCSTRVFAKEFMAKFGSATDKERKTLLEGILGLERFDAAEKLAREQARALGKELSDLAVQDARLDGYKKARAAQLEALPPAISKEEADAALQAILDRIGPAEVEWARVNQLAVDAGKAAAARQAEARMLAQQAIQAAQRLAKVRADAAAGLVDSCPVCLRPLSPGDLATVRAHGDGEVAKAQAALVDLEAQGQAAAADAAEMQSEASALGRRAREMKLGVDQGNGEVGRATEALARAHQRADERARLEKELGDAVDQIVALREKLTERQGALAHAEAAVEVLGLRGARTMLLGRALARLEHEANLALASFGSGLRVKIGGKTTQKSGREVDAVSVEVDGAGGGNYRGASGGEKVRLDVGILLGLAALLGADGGLLVFDEVFDSLDEEGVERVAEFLAAKAQTNQVLVISHNPLLQALFPRATVWRTKARAGNDAPTELLA